MVVAALVLTAPALAITFGQPDDDKHPTVGALIVRLHDEDGTLIPFCSGTLVSERVFLTAGHCTFFADEFFGAVGFDIGATFRTNLGSLAASDVTFGTGHTHPAFFPNAANASKNAVDLGLVVLGSHPPGVEGWSQLPEEGLLEDIDLREASFTTVGYGAVREDKTKGPNALLPNALRRFALQSASHLNGSWLKLNMNPSTGNGGTCFGDSGGPHFLEDTATVVSVTSWGDSPCRSTDWTARVDTESALEFINSFID